MGRSPQRVASSATNMEFHDRVTFVSEMKKQDHLVTFTKAMNIGAAICGLFVIACGSLGVYWGSKIIHPWPPSTWNNVAGGLFMITFGIGCVIMGAMAESDHAKNFQKGGLFAFCDTLLGRGCFFVFLALRCMPLGKGVCLVLSLAVLFFGIGNIILYFMAAAPADKSVQTMNTLTAINAVLVMVAGVLGFYWGTKLIKPWPPLTWNNCIGGIFMFFFGLIAFWIAFKGNDEKGQMVLDYFGFIDYFLGRGCFFIFLGLRIMPLGQYVCLVIGMITLCFGFLNVVAHFCIEADKGICKVKGATMGSLVGQ